MSDTACAEKLKPGRSRLTTGVLRDTSALGYVPKKNVGSGLLPVLLLVPERNQTPDEVLDEFELFEMADELGVLLIAVDGVTHPEAPDLHPVGRTILDRFADVVEVAADNCGDPERVFLFGHGAGARAVDHIHCAGNKIAGAITHAHRHKDSRIRDCEAAASGYLYLAPLRDMVDPVEGCATCDGEPMSLSKHEEVLRTWHGCNDDARVVMKHNGSTCLHWTCRHDVFSCHMDAKRHWPGHEGGKHRESLATDFPLSEVLGAYISSGGSRLTQTESAPP